MKPETIRLLRPTSKWLFFIILVVLPNFYWVGKEMRFAQEVAFQCLSIGIMFAMFMLPKRTVRSNPVMLWLGIFGMLTLVLYCIGQCRIGYNYVMNVLCAYILLFGILSMLGKEDIPFLMDAILWVAAFNTFYAIGQMFQFDLVGHVNRGDPNIVPEPCGLLALPAHYGIYVAVAMMVFAIKYPKTAALFYIPLAISKSSAVIAAATIAYIYILWQRRYAVTFPFRWWYRTKKWYRPAMKKVRVAVFYPAVLVLAIGAIGYIKFYDAPMGTFKTRIPAWKMIIHDSFQTPLLGKGLDWFRQGNWCYLMNPDTNQTVHAIKTDTEHKYMVNETDCKKFGVDTTAKFDIWDNIHNELITGLYHYGILSWVILGVLVFFCKERLKGLVMTPQLVSIVAVAIVFAGASMTHFPLHLARTGHLIPFFLGFFLLYTET